MVHLLPKKKRQAAEKKNVAKKKLGLEYSLSYYGYEQVKQMNGENEVVRDGLYICI